MPQVKQAASGVWIVGSDATINATVSGTVAVSNFPATQPVTSVDGGIVAIGAQADAAWAGSGNGSLVGLLKGVFNRLAKGQSNNAGSLSVALSSDQFTAGALPVSVSNTPSVNSTPVWQTAKGVAIGCTTSATPNTWTLAASSLTLNSRLMGVLVSTNGNVNKFVSVATGTAGARNNTVWYGYVGASALIMLPEGFAWLADSNNQLVWFMCDAASAFLVATFFYV